MPDPKFQEIVGNDLSINFENVPHTFSPHHYPGALKLVSVFNNKIKELLLKGSFSGSAIWSAILPTNGKRNN